MKKRKSKVRATITLTNSDLFKLSTSQLEINLTTCRNILTVFKLKGKTWNSNSKEKTRKSKI